MSSHHSLQALLLALVLACVFASAVAQQSGPLCACPGCTRQPSLAPSSSYIKSHDFTCDDSHQLVMRRVAVAPHCDSTGCDRISLFITASGYRRLDTTSGCYVNATQQPVEAFPSHINAAFSIRVRCDSGLQAGRNCSYWLSAQYDCVPIGMRLGWSTQVVWATPASPVGATSIIVPSSRSLDAQCALDSCAGCTTLSIPYGETAGISSGVCTTAGTGYAYPRPFMGSMYVAAVEASTRFRVLLSDRTTLTRAGGDLAYAGGSSSLLTPGAVNCYRNEQPQGQMIGGGYGTTNSMSALILCDSPAGCSVLLRITAGCADSRFPSDLSAPMDSCLNSCAAGAACSAGVCTCPDGFTGPDCDTPIVVPALVPAAAGSGWIGEYALSSPSSCDPTQCCCYTNYRLTLQNITYQSYAALQVALKRGADGVDTATSAGCPASSSTFNNLLQEMPVYNAFTFASDRFSSVEYDMRMVRDSRGGGNLTFTRTYNGVSCAAQATCAAAPGTGNSAHDTQPLSHALLTAVACASVLLARRL